MVYLPAVVVAVVLTADSEAVGAEIGHSSEKFKQNYFRFLFEFSLPSAMEINLIEEKEKNLQIYEFRYFLFVC